MKCLILTVAWLVAMPLAMAAPLQSGEGEDTDIPLPYEIGNQVSAQDIQRHAASFIAMDFRFFPELAREGARYRMSPGFAESYSAARTKKLFDGSEDDYAIMLAVNRMWEPFYGHGAAIYCPPNDPTYVVLLRRWRGEEIDCQTYSPLDRYGKN